MIVMKRTKSYIQMDGRPDEDWRSDRFEPVFIVPDGTALAEKIVAHSPYFDFVLDDNGELADITPGECPPAPVPGMTEDEERDAMLLDLDYRITLLENGGI